MSAARCHRVLITGAGSGIGAQLAGHLSRSGHTIVVTDLDATAALKTADRLNVAGGVASSARLDVADASQVSAVVKAAGPIDVLVNNAGLQQALSALAPRAPRRSRSDEPEPAQRGAASVNQHVGTLHFFENFPRLRTSLGKIVKSISKNHREGG